MGLNFAPVPTKFPLQDTIAGMEETARKLPKEDTDDLQMRIGGILRSSKLPEDNITKEQQKALKEMSNWKDEVILPADKENAMVVMERGTMTGRLGSYSTTPTCANYQRTPRPLKSQR